MDSKGTDRTGRFNGKRMRTNRGQHGRTLDGREKCNDHNHGSRLPFFALHERVKFPAATPYARDIIISLV